MRMKYIRTTNGRIYEIIEETENSFELCSPFEKKVGCSCTMIKRMLGSNEKPTYRLADTIEELCDEFVYEILSGEIEEPIYKEIHNTIVDIKTQLKIYEYNMMSVCAIYGAIWTEKGLIYVAKMNEEGEFELL